MMNPHALAKRLGGSFNGEWINIPGPGHGSKDRSLGFKFEGDKLRVNSLAGDPWQLCIPHVEAELRAIQFEVKQHDRPRSDIKPKADNKPRALAIWAESQPWQGSLVETYLERRGVALPADCLDVRFNPSCPMFNEELDRTEFVPAMVALVRSVSTKEPMGIWRTHLNLDGTKGRLGRMALGQPHDGVVMLTPYNRVWMHLGIGEGIETSLSLRKLPYLEDLPVWAALNTSLLAKFHLPNIDELVIAVDHDRPNERGIKPGERAAKVCANLAADHGTNVTLITPTKLKSDLNDLVKGAAS